jgi:phage tail-like protein
MSVSNNISNHESSYLKYLPAIYRDDEFVGQLLLLFESILSPIERSVENMAIYFDPLMTPEHFLAWLASWLDLSLDPTWPEYRRRELITHAAELYRWRGTRKGLIDYISIYAGIEPEIYEYTPGMMLDEDTRMGSDAQLGSGIDWYHFTVILPIDKGSKIEDSKIRSIIEAQKPAHSTYTLRFRQRSAE